MSTANNYKIEIPASLVWVQCIAFVVLYAVWILPEVVGFRNTALVVGTLAGVYPIYQYRKYFLQKSAISICLIAALFVWVIFHLFFLSQDHVQQLLELKRIWKYAALAVIFALGLGLSLASIKSKQYSRLMYFGLMSPVLIYLAKYLLTILEINLGSKFAVHPTSVIASAVWVAKYNYVAFCLPTLAIAFGQIRAAVNSNSLSKVKSALITIGNIVLICAILFLFYQQDIRNGIAYALICFIFFIILMVLFTPSGKRVLLRLVLLLGFSVIIGVAFYQQTHKNPQWNTLMQDAKIALQTDKYSQWKFAGMQGYPTKDGVAVSISNYERIAWAKIGIQLAQQNPLGYGLIEDSFKRLAKAKWPEVSPNLSHSHSGWIDLILALGYPGFICVFGALLYSLWQSRSMDLPWKNWVFWGLLANLLLWCTTEVCTNITFIALLFWLALASGLSIKQIPSSTN